MRDLGEADPTTAGGLVTAATGETLRVQSGRIAALANRFVLDGRTVLDGQAYAGSNEEAVFYKSLAANVDVTGEAVVLQLFLPANSLTIGSTFGIDTHASAGTGSVTLTWRVRFGTAGTTSDTLISPAMAVTTSANVSSTLTALATCRSETSWLANGFAGSGANTSGTNVITAAVATSGLMVGNWLSVTAQMSSGTVTVANALIRLRR